MLASTPGSAGALLMLAVTTLYLICAAAMGMLTLLKHMLTLLGTQDS